MSTVLQYRNDFSDIPRVKVRRGISGQGLFFLYYVKKGAILIDYKGNRVKGDI